MNTNTTIEMYFRSLEGSECDRAVKARNHAARVADAQNKLESGWRLFMAEGNRFFWGKPAPEEATWTTGLHRTQRPRRDADLDELGRLDVGESRECVRGYHPRHGEKFVTLTRIA